MSQLVENKNQEYTQTIQEDEINLKELFLTVLNHKYKIVVFICIVTFLTLIYVLKLPNYYKSEIILSSQNSENNVSGGLSSLASFAGISLGKSRNSKEPFILMQTVLNDYEFNKYVIKKYDLVTKLANKQNQVYVFGFDFFKPENKNIENKDSEDILFNTYLRLKGILDISVNKKTSLITLTAQLPDRFLAKELVDLYLEESINKIKLQDMKEIDKQIVYYNKELSNSYDVSLKEQLSKSLSSLMQKKVFSLANDYYFVSKITDSRVANIREKTKPKRAFILVVSFVVSSILAILLVFFYEFIRQDKNEVKA